MTRKQKSQYALPPAIVVVRRHDTYRDIGPYIRSSTRQKAAVSSGRPSTRQRGVIEAARDVEPDSVPGVLPPVDRPTLRWVPARGWLDEHPEEQQRERKTPDPPHLPDVAGEELIDRSIDRSQCVVP